MKYVLDEIIDNIAILESLETKEKENIDVSLLPEDIYEGAILIKENDKYKLDNDAYKSRIELMREKLNRVKNIQRSDHSE